MQFYYEKNKELTLPKTLQSPIVQPSVAQLDKYSGNGEKSLLLVGKEIDGDIDSVVGVVFHCDLVVNGVT